MTKLEKLIEELCPNGVEYKPLEELGSFYGGITGKSKDDFKDGNAKFITYKKCKTLKVTSKEPINLCMDGDSFIYDDVELSIVPQALNFWLPKGAEVQSVRLKETVS